MHQEEFNIPDQLPDELQEIWSALHRTIIHIRQRLYIDLRVDMDFDDDRFLVKVGDEPLFLANRPNLIMAFLWGIEFGAEKQAEKEQLMLKTLAERGGVNAPMLNQHLLREMEVVVEG